MSFGFGVSANSMKRLNLITLIVNLSEKGQSLACWKQLLESYRSACHFGQQDVTVRNKKSTKSKRSEVKKWFAKLDQLNTHPFMENGRQQPAAPANPVRC